MHAASEGLRASRGEAKPKKVRARGRDSPPAPAVSGKTGYIVGAGIELEQKQEGGNDR
jgi:hypothetical protein